MKKILFILSTLGILFISCNKDGYNQSKSGLKYKFFTENKDSALAKVNDVVTLKMKYYKVSNDSLLFNTDEVPNEFKMQVRENTYDGGSFEDGIQLMHLGDSIEFFVDAESLYAKTIRRPLPKFLDKGEKIRFVVKLVKIQSMEEIKEEQKVLTEKMKNEEDQLLADYIKENNIKETPSQSGLYIIYQKHGNGAKTIPQKEVTVHYTGYLLNGKKFDSSVDRNQPFKFILGAGRVIPAWDEAVSQLKIGDKVRIIAPSAIAYGARGAGGGVIPPYSTLIFDIEVLDVAK